MNACPFVIVRIALNRDDLWALLISLDALGVLGSQHLVPSTGSVHLCGQMLANEKAGKFLTSLLCHIFSL